MANRGVCVQQTHEELETYFKVVIHDFYGDVLGMY